MYKHLLFTFTFQILITWVYAQTASISGIITNSEAEVLPGAIIQIGQEYHTISDINGKYEVKKIKPTTQTITVSYQGFKTYTKIIDFSAGQAVTLNIELVFSSEELEAVTIQGKSIAEENRETGYAIDILETKNQVNLSIDLNQMLKTVSGVNIRETGGLGSGFTLSLNGLSGNQVRYFIDGIPMENFGSALTLNNFPVNLIDQIEIFKGVVPIRYGADALGGAINIKTGFKQESFIDASYSYGSFNTHRLALNGQYSNTDKGFYARILSFFNHSDNNYTMRGVPVYDQNGNSLGDIDSKRFHDQYTSGMLNAELGVNNRKYADNLSFKFTYAQNRNNYQHPDFNILRPFGDFHTSDRTYLFTGNYTKTFKKIELSAYILGGINQLSIVDTSTRRFNWAGNSFLRDTDDPKGELFERRSLFVLKDKILRSQLFLKYHLAPSHNFELSLSQNFLRRDGEDQVDEFNQSFEVPNNIQKNVLGVAYNYQNKKENFKATIFGKEYFFAGKIITQDFESNDITSKPSFMSTGYGMVASYQPLRTLTLKASYEKAYRIPESYEILGDGIYALPNPELMPEASDNINLGFHFRQYFVRSKLQLQSDINLFYRFARDFIRPNFIGPFGTFENLRDARVQGLEGSLRLEYDQLLQLQLSLTYQDMTDRSPLDEGLPNTNYKSRIPNFPYFFGNTRIGISPLKKSATSKLTFYWRTQYVHEFFLIWENLGNPEDKNTIPTQFIHGIDLEYSILDGKYNFSASITNLTNELAYDNFRIQKPGRAVYFKFRYLFRKPNN